MCADTSGRPILAKEQTGLACVFVQVVFAAGSVCLFAYACVYVCVVHKPDDFLYVGHQIRLIDLWFRLLKSIAGNIRFSPAISHPVRAGYIQCSLNEHQSRFSVRLIPALTLGIQTLLLGGNKVNHSLQWMPRATLKSPSSVMLLVHDKNTHQRSYLWWCHGNNLHFLSLTLRCCVCGGGAFRVAQ